MQSHLLQSAKYNEPVCAGIAPAMNTNVPILADFHDKERERDNRLRTSTHGHGIITPRTQLRYQLVVVHSTLRVRHDISDLTSDVSFVEWKRILIIARKILGKILELWDGARRRDLAIFITEVR